MRINPPTLAAIALTLLSAPIPHAQAQTATSSISVQPFSELYSEKALDALTLQYQAQGKTAGARYCFGNANAYPSEYSSESDAQSIQRLRLNLWGLDRCVSNYYDQQPRTWGKFLATNPIATFTRYWRELR